MSTLTNSGRAFLTKAVKDATLFVGWGSGNANWDTNRSVSIAFGGDGKLSLGFTEVDFVVVYPDGSSVGDDDYTEGVDYTVNLFTV